MNLVEIYRNTLVGPQCVIARYVVHPQILVGGSITSVDDAKHLQRKHGVTDVISLDDLPFNLRALEPLGIGWHWAFFPDSGAGALTEDLAFKILHDAKNRFAFNPHARLYVHCRMGMSRSPSLAYGILRACFGVERAKAVEMVREAGPTPDWGLPGCWLANVPIYLDVIEKVLPRLM